MELVINKEHLEGKLKPMLWTAEKQKETKMNNLVLRPKDRYEAKNANASSNDEL